MITLRRAELDDFEIYKAMFSDETKCWTIFEENEFNLTQKEITEDIELERISEYYQNYKKEYFEDELVKDYMYVYIIYDDDEIIGYVNIDFCWNFYKKVSDGKRKKGARYHIGEFGLKRNLTYAKKAEVIKKVTELNLPNMCEIVLLANTDEANKALIENGFVKTDKIGFYMKTWEPKSKKK